MPSALIHDFCRQCLKPAVNSKLKQTVVQDSFKQFLDDSGVDKNTKHSLISRRNLSNLYANIEAELQKLYPDVGIHCNKSNGYQVYQNVSLT